MRDTYGPQRINPNHLACSTGSSKVSHGKIFQHLLEEFGTDFRGPQRIDGEFGDPLTFPFAVENLCLNILPAI